MVEHKNITFEDILKDFKSEGKNLLHIAASSGHTPSLNYFLQRCPAAVKSIINLKDDKGLTAIINATISENDANMVSLLHIPGCDVNAANNDGASAIHFAAGDGSIKRMKILIDAGANLTIKSNAGNALHWAASKGHSAAVDFLISTQKINVNEFNSQGLPAILLAAVSNSDACVESLIKAGADIGLILSGNLTLLHICAENGLSNSVNAILGSANGQKCCSVTTDEGNLPIHYAAMAENKVIIASLLPPSRPFLTGIDVSGSDEATIEAIILDGKHRLDEWNKKHEKKASSDNNGSNSSSGGGEGGGSVFQVSGAASPEDAAQAVVHKDLGNEHYKKKDYASALSEYSKAISLHGNEQVYYSNRSACYIAMNDAENALRDAEICRQLSPSWPKGCYRLAAARLALKRYEDAAVAAFEGLKLDDGNAELKKILELSVKLGKEEHIKNTKKP